MTVLELSVGEVSDLRDCVNDRIENLREMRVDMTATNADREYARDTIADLERLDRMLAARLSS